MTDVTKAAAEGYDWHRKSGDPLASAGKGTDFDAACPYYHSSPNGMAWHLGRHLAAADRSRPTPDAALNDRSRVAITMGRGYTLNLRGYKQILLGRFRWNEDNTFSEVRQ